MAIITAIPCGTIVCRENKDTITHSISERIKTQEYNKRHDEFMAVGGTRVLKNYSDNVAIKIAEFKQSKARMML